MSPTSAVAQTSPKRAATSSARTTITCTIFPRPSPVSSTFSRTRESPGRPTRRTCPPTRTMATSPSFIYPYLSFFWGNDINGSDAQLHGDELHPGGCGTVHVLHAQAQPADDLRRRLAGPRARQARAHLQRFRQSRLFPSTDSIFISSTRLRLINPGTSVPLHVSVDTHVLTLIETDGTSLSPKQVRDVLLRPAQRYSVMITPDASLLTCGEEEEGRQDRTGGG
ncbi:hypothetical protein DFH07DRAFT_14172 [Mycena maculata]|uniref:Plastocyanin-like domain-containing protein n=1 Tax=Mycena maculata TaxID=230809 RepID=A0AAD7IP69_9AGAR|nr:hypothetical protein DFH07DRAFT_14172 [Mycena maculata]